MKKIIVCTALAVLFACQAICDDMDDYFYILDEEDETEHQTLKRNVGADDEEEDDEDTDEDDEEEKEDDEDEEEDGEDEAEDDKRS